MLGPYILHSTSAIRVGNNCLKDSYDVWLWARVEMDAVIKLMVYKSGTQSWGVKRYEHKLYVTDYVFVWIIVFHFYCLLKERHHGTCSQTIGDDEDLQPQQLFSSTFIGIH